MEHIPVFCAFFFDQLFHITPIYGGRGCAYRDLKCMTKVVNGVLVLRKSNSSAWTTDLDNGMNEWVKEYTSWLETAHIAIEEALSAKCVKPVSTSSFWSL